MPVLRRVAGSGVLTCRLDAKSDAAKLQHSVIGFAVEACSEFRRPISRMLHWACPDGNVSLEGGL
jgi:hypothetical protein